MAPEVKSAGLNGLTGLFEIPILIISRVHHIGDMDVAGAKTGSQEAHCLSVSNCPMAWRQISRLGGRPLQQLSKKDGIFLDVIRCLETPEIRLAIESYAVSAGYAQRATLYRAWGYDSEDDAWRFSLHKTQSAALNELDSDAEYETASDVPGPNDHTPGVESVQVLTGTMDLQLRTRQYNLESSDVLDLIAICWAEDYLDQVDGAWWAETYHPESLSAPRGGIFPSRLGKWSVTTQSSFPDDLAESAIEDARPISTLQREPQRESDRTAVSGPASPKARKGPKP